MTQYRRPTTELKGTSEPRLLVGRREMARLLDVSEATLDRMNAAGKIGPRPLKVSAGRIAWSYESVRRWVTESERGGELIGRRDWLAREGSKA